MAYNQYGVLLDDNVQDFTLECDENIGVCNGKTFVATSSTANGNLTVKVGDVKYIAPLQVVVADVKMRLDSVVVDQNVDYPIEVLSGDMLVNPAAFDWTIDNPDIVAIDENGFMNGLQNGRTIVRCDLDGKQDSLLVISEINEPMLDIDLEGWKVKSSSTKWNATLQPVTSECNAKLTFSYTSARAPYIQLVSNLRLYSLPKKVAFTFNPNEALFDNVTISVKANNANRAIFVEYLDVKQNKEQTFMIDLVDVMGDDDIAIYPLVLSSIKFNINTDMEKKNHVVDIKSLQLIYDENFVVEIDDITKANELIVYPNPAKDYIIVEGKEGDEVRVYDLEGKVLSQFIIHNAKFIINTSSWKVGTYIIKSNSASCKVIIK